MNKGKFSAIAVLAVLTAAPALAGVVVEQQTSSSAGAGGTQQHTIMVQGNKEKMVMPRQTVIIDLDKGQMYLISPESKTYSEMPFPPQGQMGEMMKTMSGAAMDFKKAGTHQTIAGFSCEDYNGSGKTMMGEMSSKGCFSTEAPGAAEFSALYKTMLAKMKGAGMGGTLPSAPSGVPLKTETSTKITNFSIPGMPPEQAKMMSQMMANRPPITTTTTVTSVKAQNLPADTFAVPAGFAKQDMAMGMGGMGGMGHMGGGGMGGMPHGPGAGGPPAAPPQE